MRELLPRERLLLLVRIGAVVVTVLTALAWWYRHLGLAIVGQILLFALHLANVALRGQQPGAEDGKPNLWLLGALALLALYWRQWLLLLLCVAAAGIEWIWFIQDRQHERNKV